MKKYDLIVIGGGTSGVSLAHRAGAHNWQVALVEKSKLGGTCINVGCIPSKTLIGSAKVLHMIRDSGQYGIHTGEASADWPAIVKRKDELVARIRNRSYKNIEGKTNITLYEGEAVFDSPHRVRVNDDILSAERIVIAAGARTAIPPLTGLDKVSYLTSTSVMELEQLPDSLLIVGGGIIALEFSQLLSRLGVEVTIIQRDQRLAPNLDPDISEEIRRILETENVGVITGFNVKEVGRSAKGVYVSGEGATGTESISGSSLLVATGRMPNSDRLNLAAAGIDTDQRGYVKVDNNFKTSGEGVWAVGDITGGMMFTHKAWHDSLLLSRYLMNNEKIEPGKRAIPFAIYTEPEIAGVGINETTASASGLNVKVYKYPFAYQGRARAIGKIDGFVKLIANKEDGIILGAHIIGPEAGELIHELITAIYFKATINDLRDIIHVHPTLSEAILNSAWSR